MDRTFARLSIIAAILFLVIVLALMFLTEVDALKYGISFYALTNFRAVIGIAIASVGLSAMFLGIALWRNVSAAGRVGTALLIGWGMLSMPASIFPLDAPGAVPTLSGTIHNVAGLSFLLAVPAVLLIEFSGLRSESLDRRAGKATYWFAHLVPISAILLFAFNGPFSSLEIGGLIQRLYWLVFTVWLIFKAQQLLPTNSQ